jgi:hypothetical protein
MGMGSRQGISFNDKLRTLWRRAFFMVSSKKNGVHEWNVETTYELARELGP